RGRVSFAARAFAPVSLALLVACAKTVQVPVTPAPPPSAIPPSVPAPPANARTAGVRLVPAASTIYDAWAKRALGAFQTSCPVLLKRQDQSGLARPEDWAPLCAEASATAPDAAAAFFRDRFDWVSVGTGQAFATGYHEP